MVNYSTKDISSPDDVSACWKLTLKDRVRFILAIKGKRDSWLADEVQINKGTLSKILNGWWQPSSAIKIRIAQVLGVDSLVLFGDKQYFLDYQRTIRATKLGGQKEDDNRNTS